MARIAGINIPQNKLVHIGLTYIYGIGDKFSNQICTSLEIPKAKRINELTDDKILKPLACNALKAVSRPDPGPFTSTDKVFIPYSNALEAAASAAICAA